jgi:hypothetical protein
VGGSYFSGTVTTSFQIGGTLFSLNGLRGHEIFPTAFSPWNIIAKNWIWARIVAGPYTAIVCYYTSSIDSKLYVSAFLTKGDTVLFPGPSRNASFTLSLLHDGGLSDNIINATGFGLDFVETSAQQKRWYFGLNHNRLELQYYSA